MSGPDSERALIRALRAAYPDLQVLESRSRPWASVTFTGTRHCLCCRTDATLDGIGEAEFGLAGHVVIDIAARRDGDRIEIEALTIEDA